MNNITYRIKIDIEINLLAFGLRSLNSNNNELNKFKIINKCYK